MPQLTILTLTRLFAMLKEGIRQRARIGSRQGGFMFGLGVGELLVVLSHRAGAFQPSLARSRRGHWQKRPQVPQSDKRFRRNRCHAEKRPRQALSGLVARSYASSAAVTPDR